MTIFIQSTDWGSNLKPPSFCFSLSLCVGDFIYSCAFVALVFYHYAPQCFLHVDRRDIPINLSPLPSPQLTPFFLRGTRFSCDFYDEVQVLIYFHYYILNLKCSSFHHARSCGRWSLCLVIKVFLAILSIPCVNKRTRDILPKKRVFINVPWVNTYIQRYRSVIGWALNLAIRNVAVHKSYRTAIYMFALFWNDKLNSFAWFLKIARLEFL